MKVSLPLAIVFVSFALTGCAAMENSSVQRVEFVTQDIIGADCRAENRKYAYNIYTPEIMTLERSSEPLTLTCRKEGYKTTITEIPVQINPATYQNAWHGFFLGAAYDMGARTIHKFPDTVIIQMEPLEDNLTRGENILPIYEDRPAYDDSEVPRLVPPVETYIEPADRSVDESLTGRKSNR